MCSGRTAASGHGHDEGPHDKVSPVTGATPSPAHTHIAQVTALSVAGCGGARPGGEWLRAVPIESSLLLWRQRNSCREVKPCGGDVGFALST